MTFIPPTLPDLKTVAQWRTTAPEALRTPYLVSERHQEEYYERIQNTHEWRMFSVWDSITGEEPRLVAFCGLQDIQWENGLAEISLIVSPDYRMAGVGAKAADELLRIAGEQMRLNQIWGECYGCGHVGFWGRWVESKGGFKTMLPKRKWWAGKYWDSLYFSVPC